MTSLASCLISDASVVPYRWKSVAHVASEVMEVPRSLIGARAALGAGSVGRRTSVTLVVEVYIRVKSD